MAWRQDDALSVALRVSARPDHPALPRGDWVVLRDFLRYGLEQPTGDGDVRLFPDRSRLVERARQRDGCGTEGFDVPATVHLELTRPGRRPYFLAVPGPLLADFVAETERRIPVGEERSDALLEDFIERLLRS